MYRSLRSRSLALGLALGLALAFAPRLLAADGPVTAVRCGAAVDVARGTTIPHAVILIRDGRIQGVGPGLPIPAGAQVVDLGDATVLPGLIDAHTHLLT